MKRNFIVVLLFCLPLLGIAGCTNSEDSAPKSLQSSGSLPDQNQEDPTNPEVSPTATAQVLLFNGMGISTTDWQSLEKIIQSMGLTYQLVNSATLNAMSLAQMETYRLIIIPGGNSNVINNYLTKSTRIRVRQAVRDGGVSFLGICAGAYAAVGIDSLSNTTAYYGFAVAQGDYLTSWNPALLTAIPKISFADGSSRYVIWWDGPSTPEYRGGVVARYPNGKPAISETWTGKGFVMVSGPHPEAPSSWWWDTGTDPDGVDHDIAIKLIRATLNRTPLPAY
jgi:hypothetical protein